MRSRVAFFVSALIGIPAFAASGLLAADGPRITGPSITLPGTSPAPAPTPAPATAPAAAISVGASTLPTPGAAAFSEAQLERVRGWIRAQAPECPAEAATAAAQRFLEELQRQNPDRLERLLAADFPVREYDSALLRLVGAQLTAAPQASLREELAQRRLQSLLARDPATAAAAQRDAATLMGKIKDASQSTYRRFVEGRMEDDELQLQVKKIQQPAAVSVLSAPAKPKVLTAAEIVSEFARRNQDGSALQRLEALTIEGRIRTAAGEEQQLFLYKMRPDRFRLVVRAGGTTRFILAFDGRRYWQQQPGSLPMEVKSEALSSQRYLGEFADALFGENKAGFERVEDGAAGGRKFNRLTVRRADGSTYVARIDPETFREIGRENPEGSTAAYSDFREVGGVTIAFREELTDREGKKGLFEIVRATPNPGLIQAFFEPAQPGLPDYFELEQAVRSPALATVK